jgi:hypothetical protein
MDGPGELCEYCDNKEKALRMGIIPTSTGLFKQQLAICFYRSRVMANKSNRTSGSTVLL